MPKLRKVEKKECRFHHGNLRRALVDAALQILAKEGQGAITLREVAKRAGVTHAAPYRHFASKEALLAAVAEEGFRQLHDDLEAARAGHADALEELVAYGETYLHFALKNPAHYRLMYGPEFAQRAGHPGLLDASRAAFSLLLDAVNRAQAAKVVREGDPIQIALTTWSLVHGLSLLVLDRQFDDAGIGRAQVEPIAKQALHSLRDGLAPRLPRR